MAMVCPKNQRAILGHIRDLVLIVFIGNFISFLFNQDFSDFWHRIEIGSWYSLMIGGTLWKGNQFIGWYLSRKLDYNKRPFFTLRVNLISMFIYSLIAIIIVNYIWYVWIWDWTISKMFSSGYPSMIIEFVVTIIITSIYFAIGFFQAWRESAVNEERLQKESIKLQYNALKNQVNPHFLFNSLNTLTTLVYKDPDLSAKFIKQLSEVYRYVLEHKDSELVNLDEEIAFCKHYIYLQQIRHGDNLKTNINIPANQPIMVVPLSIQLLIENAIKHNEVSDDHPLEITVDIEDQFIVVKNNLQLRTAIPDSGGIGLDTLEKRYAFLSDQHFSSEKTDSAFVVKIPLIKKQVA